MKFVFQKTRNLPPTVASMSNLHVQNAHDTLHLKSTVEDMMGSGRVDDRRQAVAETVGSSGSLGSSGVTSGSGGACQSSATVEVSGGKVKEYSIDYNVYVLHVIGSCYELIFFLFLDVLHLSSHT